MSWLLVACVPWLLMLAALWLGRLERELARQPVATPPARELTGGPDAANMRALASPGAPDPLVRLHRHPAERRPEPVPTGRQTAPRHAVPAFAVGLADRDEWTLPTRIHGHSHGNPQFRATRHVNRV
ncbi:hypothetical protein [Mycobacterium sp. E2462]|uniref:hypothetical protein n=1 Tax=Mycobacterium sp. E2462 TaxID=1834133 RepID=UPI0009ED181E|nr:hypothetical protein [Mycobacterium sp. E2462]